MAMRVIEARALSGYSGLHQSELPKPQSINGRPYRARHEGRTLRNHRSESVNAIPV